MEKKAADYCHGNSQESAPRSMLALMLACNTEANNTAPQSVFIDLQCPNGGDEAV